MGDKDVERAMTTSMAMLSWIVLIAFNGCATTGIHHEHRDCIAWTTDYNDKLNYTMITCTNGVIIRSDNIVPLPGETVYFSWRYDQYYLCHLEPNLMKLK